MTTVSILNNNKRDPTLAPLETKIHLKMPNCTRPEGSTSTCRNRLINPITNRLVLCLPCKDHNRVIQIIKKRSATRQARLCRQAAFNLKKVINLDLRMEDAALKQTLVDLETEKAAMVAMISHKLKEREALAKIQQMLPEVSTPPPDAPDATPRSPPLKYPAPKE